jgi:hypothetical protein
LYKPIIRSEGVTLTEKHLIGLSENSFLNLWSYPNPFREQKFSSGSEGKELCDLLVVCPPHIIIFSEKNIKWPDKLLDVAWSRWRKKAILKAFDQIRGAERWIKTFPEKIFLDSSCEIKLPVDLASEEDLIFHRIVVARGAGEHCKEYFRSNSKSLVLDPNMKGNVEQKSEPFVIGDLDPDGNFVHVFDDGSLDIVLSELDTISDFTRYLQKKESFLRSGKLGRVHGEENLLACYSWALNEQGEHDFVLPEGNDSSKGKINIDDTLFKHMHEHPQYLAKQKANEVSYLWDDVIRNFTKHVMAGTIVGIGDYNCNISDSEMSLRIMALEDRLSRRAHSIGIYEAMTSFVEKKQERFFRMMLPGILSEDNDTGFYILILKYLDWMDEYGGQEFYRKYRAMLGHSYLRAMLIKEPKLACVVGIVLQPNDENGGSSEDLYYGKQQEWLEDEINSVRKLCDELGIGILSSSLNKRELSFYEFPE